MANNVSWPHPPNIIVRCTGGANLGRCYNAAYYEIETNKVITAEFIAALDAAGFIGYGQTLEWNSKPEERTVMVNPVAIDSEGREMPLVPPIHPYTKQLAEPVPVKRYVYKVTRTVDSSD